MEIILPGLMKMSLHHFVFQIDFLKCQIYLPYYICMFEIEIKCCCFRCPASCEELQLHSSRLEQDELLLGIGAGLHPSRSYQYLLDLGHKVVHLCICFYSSFVLCVHMKIRVSVCLGSFCFDWAVLTFGW